MTRDQKNEHTKPALFSVINFSCFTKPKPMKTKLLFITASIFLLFSGCVKDKSYKTYTIYRPEYSVKESVQKDARIQKSEQLKDLGSFALYNNTMYINERNKGIHVIDYSNPSNPVSKGFIPIPGNNGLSIKNNVLYADCYCDLFVFKIESRENIYLQNVVKNTFPSRMGYSNYDTTYVQLTWIKKDTTVTAAYYQQHYTGILTQANSTSFASNFDMSKSANVPSGGTSVGSSMAVFTIVNDYLYTVNRTTLTAFSLSDALNPTLENAQTVGWDIETIFPFKDKLFIGSMSGMFIYGLQNPAAPAYISQFDHVRVCDPVIADDKYAFVTLRNGSRCGGFTNQMDVLNIETITSPTRVVTFPFSNPHGLSKDGNVLFVCDGASGLKLLDASDINNLNIKQSLAIGKVIDVVALNQKAFVMLDDAIRIYSYDQQFNISLLGSINKN